MSSPRAVEGTAKSLEKLYASILSRTGVFTKANSGYIKYKLYYTLCNQQVHSLVVWALEEPRNEHTSLTIL